MVQGCYISNIRPFRDENSSWKSLREHCQWYMPSQSHSRHLTNFKLNLYWISNPNLFRSALWIHQLVQRVLLHKLGLISRVGTIARIITLFELLEYSEELFKQRIISYNSNNLNNLNNYSMQLVLKPINNNASFVVLMQLFEWIR